MTDANWPLRTLLVQSYEQLYEQLRRTLRSADLAREALHDTYLQLEKGKEIREIERPIPYLMRMAINLARDRQSAGKRLASALEIDAVLQVPDHGPDPSRSAEARSEMDIIEQVLLQMPARRRRIFEASFQEGLKSREIAAHFGLSTRTIDLELKAAREECARALAFRRR